MTRVFFLGNALFSLLYLRYFAFSWKACLSRRLTFLDFFLKSFLENLGFSLPFGLRILHSLEV